MKVFIACLGTETNSFSSMPTGMITFQETMLFRGDATAHTPNTFSLPLHVWRKRAEAAQGTVVEGLAAFAQPAGPTVQPVYESLRDALLDDLRAAMPVDIVLVSMHGAMTATGCADCEGDLLVRIREMVGDGVIVGGELDLHCSITPAMVATTNALVLFKEYPHTDVGERADELFTICHDAYLGKVSPVTAVQDMHMVNMWRTTLEPMKTIVAEMQAAEGRDGILSVSFAHGFPWQDVPYTSAKMLVIADGDGEAAARTAAHFADRLWQARHQTQQSLLSIDEALDRIEAGPGPVAVADVADNAGGGAPSDSTFFLKALIARGTTGVLSGYYWDPLAVRFCEEAGVGATLPLRVGGKCGPASGDPVDLVATVRAIKTDATQSFGDATAPMGTAVWISTPGNVDLVLTTHRTQPFHIDGFQQLGIEAAQYRAIVVKSIQHFYRGFEDVAAEIVFMGGPGAIPPDFASIPYTRFRAPYWPRVEDPSP